jgi:hypothetical protein
MSVDKVYLIGFVNVSFEPFAVFYSGVEKKYRGRGSQTADNVRILSAEISI